MRGERKTGVREKECVCVCVYERKIEMKKIDQNIAMQNATTHTIPGFEYPVRVDALLYTEGLTNVTT